MCLSKYFRKYPWTMAGISMTAMSAISFLYLSQENSKSSPAFTKSSSTTVALSAKEVSKLAEEIFCSVFKQRVTEINQLYEVDSIIKDLKHISKNYSTQIQHDLSSENDSSNVIHSDSSNAIQSIVDVVSSTTVEHEYRPSQLVPAEDYFKNLYWKALIQNTIGRLCATVSIIVDDLLLSHCLAARGINVDTAIRWVLKTEMPLQFDWSIKDNQVLSMDTQMTLPVLSRFLRSKVSSCKTMESPAAVINEVLNTDDCQMLRYTFKDRLLSVAISYLQFGGCSDSKHLAGLLPNLRESIQQITNGVAEHISDFTTDPLFCKFQANIISILSE